MSDATTTPSPADADASPPPAQLPAMSTPSRSSSGGSRRASLEARSATFGGAASTSVGSDTLARSKAGSREAVRAFEAQRAAQLDAPLAKDRAYWRHFEAEVARAKDENARLQRFFALRLQADLAYAESLRRIRQAVEKPAATAVAAAAAGSAATASSEQLGVFSSCAKALNTLGEGQQQQAEKLAQFAGVVRRDVVLRPLEEMIATYDERSAALLAEGHRLDAMLHGAQQSVLVAFAKFDAAAETRVGAAQDDLWLAEVVYSIHVRQLRRARVAYVTGMSTLFQQYKTLEVMRVAVVQTALDTYIRKQKLLYDELAGGMAEPMAAVNRIDPDRDLLQSVRRIPKNHTAAALAAEEAEQTLFGSLRSPIASPLLVRCGFLKLQVTGSLFRSWKDVLCAVTQDEFLHLIELRDGATRAIAQSSDAMLDAIACHEQTREVQCASVCLTHCRVEILKADAPTFEVTELTAATGLLGAMFRLETTRKFTFQCASQSDLLDWVIAAKKFLSTGSSSSSTTATAQHGANRPSM